MLTLDTLGSLGLTRAGGHEVSAVLAQPKRYGLLVYLAVVGGFHRRDTLLTLFWPELGESRARNALSQGLSYLRRNLPETTLLSRGTEEVGVDPSVVSVDSNRFDEAVAGGRWAEALDLYRGDFLRGFHVTGAPGFEEWMQAERDRLRDAAASAAWALGRGQVQRGALAEAERTVKRALRLGFPDEGTVRTFMSAMVAAGSRVAALRVFERFAERLKEELELEPSEGLKGFTEELRSGGGGGSHLVAEPTQPTASDVFPFKGLESQVPEGEGLRMVGREGELHRLEGFLDGALGGSGSVAFVTGEAGTGKTRLAQGFTSQSLKRHEELAVATGYCDSHTGLGDPFHPFREILRLLTGDVEAQWMAGSISTDHAKRLWNLLPVTTEALLQDGPDLLGTFVDARRLASRASASGKRSSGLAASLLRVSNGLEEGPQGNGRASLFDQFERVIRRISKVRPLFLVLEDLQWADSGTVDLLFHLGRHLAGTHVLLLGIFRPSEVAYGENGERHPLQKVINEFQSMHGNILVSLDQDEDRPFVDALVDSRPNRLGLQFREALFQRTGGHALFTVELMRGLAAEGGLRKDNEEKWIEGPDLDWGLLPAKIEAVIEERTGRLSEPLRRFLSVASVEGENFTLEAVSRVLGEEPDVFLPLVSGELEKRHCLVRLKDVSRVNGQRLSVFRFRHILFQSFLYQSLDSAERAYLHERVGRALEELYGDERGERALVLSRHFREAGLLEEAVEYLLMAANRARTATGYTECMALYREALALVRTLPESSDRDEKELAVASPLSTMAWVLGFVDEATQSLLTRMKRLAEVLGDEESLFWACCCEASKHHYAGEQEAVHRSLEEATAVAERSGNPGHEVQLEALRGLNALNLGNPSDMVAHLERFEAIFDPMRDKAVMAHWMPEPVPAFRALKALGVGPMGFPEQAVEAIKSAHGLLPEEADPAANAIVWCYDMLLGWLLRDAESACSVEEPYTSAAKKLGQSAYLPLGRFSRGWCAVQLDRPTDGLGVMESALEEMEEFGWAVWRPYLDALLADALRREGQVEKALTLVGRSLERVEQTGERGQEAEVNRIRGEILLSIDPLESGGAEAAFRRAISISQKQKTRLFELRATLSLARLLRSQGRENEARETLRKCYDWFTEGFEFLDLKEAKALLDELG